MEIIMKNKASTVGVVTGLDNLKNIGDFTMADLSEWIERIKLMYGEDAVVNVGVRLSDDSRTPAYVMSASLSGEPDLAVLVCGQYRKDGKRWDEP
jgi:hypothetical protein